MVYETEDDIIVVDTGFMLPNADMPGVDLILPDIHYLVERQEKIRGILLTHGHEDHIGALFYVLRQLNVPVYGTQLTLAIASGRLREYDVLSKAQLNTIAPGDTIELGDFFSRIYPCYTQYSRYGGNCAAHTGRGYRPYRRLQVRHDAC